jgi:hypothetical protein
MRHVLGIVKVKRNKTFWKFFFEAADVELEESRIWLFLAGIEFFTRTGIRC